MERISDWIRGRVELALFGAFPTGVLNSAAAEGLAFWNVESAGENTVRFHTWETCLPDFQRLAEKGACELKILRRVGGRGARLRILRRPALLIGLAAMAALLVTSSLFVWDVQVRGTERVSTGSAAPKSCGRWRTAASAWAASGPASIPRYSEARCCCACRRSAG